MKKGISPMGVVIVLILALAAAGTILFIITPRLERAPGLVEGFFPEKCVSTGLTRDQYYDAITDALQASPPQFDKAIQLRTAMKACFPDADVHADVKSFIVEKGVKAVDFAKLDDGTTKSLREAYDKYIKTKDLMSPNEFPTIALLLFARGFYYFKGYSTEGMYLLDVVLERRGITDAQKAEAMALKALFLEREGRLEEALKIYADIIDKFGKSTSPDVQLYAGIACLKTNKARESIPLLTSAVSSESIYAAKLARIELAEAQYLSGNPVEAAKLLEPYTAPAASKDALEYAQAIEVYAKVPAQDRTVKDCQPNTISPEKCVCRFSGGTVIIQPEDKQYCCTTGLSSKPCICANVKECKDYPTNELCNADPCKLMTTKLLYAQYVENICLWNYDADVCEMKTRGYMLY